MRLDTEDGVATSDSATVTATKRHPVSSTPSTKEKIIGYSSVAIGVVGFTIFLYFYIAPLCKARSYAKRAKKRRMLLKPFPPNDRKIYGLNESSSFYSCRSHDHEPLLPRKALLKDSITPSRAGPGAPARIDLKPILSRLPAARNDPELSPFSDFNAISGEFLTSSPPRDPSGVLNSVVPNLSESLSFTFVISNSEDSLKANLLALSHDSTPLRTQISIPSHIDTLSPSRSRSGSIPPRSSSLRNLVAVDSQYSSHTEPGTSKATTISLDTQGDPAVYADVILPSYLRDSIKPSHETQAFVCAAELKRADEEYENVPAIVSSDAEKADAVKQIESLHVRETVLARASSYTRGLVGGSSPRLGKPVGTELQFEIVKHRQTDSAV